MQILSLFITQCTLMQFYSAYNETCMDHEFECSNRECVSVDYICDGEIDCYDGSDELNCQSSHPNGSVTRTF